MSLRNGLVLGLCLVVALAFVATVVFAMSEARARSERQVSATLGRVSAVLGVNRRMDPDEPLSALTRGITGDVSKVLSPGTCAEFEEVRIARRRLCADWQVFGPIAPGWFRDLLGTVIGSPAPVSGEGIRNRSDRYRAEVAFDPVAFSTLVWSQTRLAAAQALVMGAGVLVLGIALIFRSTRPVQPIVAELEALGAGRYQARVRLKGFAEFRRIEAAVNALAGRLERAEAERRALTRRLLSVEDAERRQLARDLHDEFGQILTATGALSAGIARRADGTAPEIAEDARAVGVNIRLMMETLRGAFARLRPPDLAELGLAASLRRMAGSWSAARGGQVRFDVEVSGLNEQGLAPETALALYRIVQEAITNAIRHGAPTRIRIDLSGGDGRPLVLTVEDDGGGRLGPETDQRGHGIPGIAERVEAMGGRLDVGSTGQGVRIDVEVPAPRLAA